MPTENQPQTEVIITYCRQCGWLLRASWYSQELLTTFAESLERVSLVPATGGKFSIAVNGTEIWDRKDRDGFPEIKELKRLVRDCAFPGMSLGHIDR